MELKGQTRSKIYNQILNLTRPIHGSLGFELTIQNLLQTINPMEHMIEIHIINQLILYLNDVENNT